LEIPEKMSREVLRKALENALSLPDATGASLLGVIVLFVAIVVVVAAVAVFRKWIEEHLATIGAGGAVVLLYIVGPLLAFAFRYDLTTNVLLAAGVAAAAVYFLPRRQRSNHKGTEPRFKAHKARFVGVQIGLLVGVAYWEQQEFIRRERETPVIVVLYPQRVGGGGSNQDSIDTWETFTRTLRQALQTQSQIRVQPAQTKAAVADWDYEELQRAQESLASRRIYPQLIIMTQISRNTARDTLGVLQTGYEVREGFPSAFKIPTDGTAGEYHQLALRTSLYITQMLPGRLALTDAQFDAVCNRILTLHSDALRTRGADGIKRANELDGREKPCPGFGKTDEILGEGLSDDAIKAYEVTKSAIRKAIGLKWR
jgi:hypothetical protein